MGRYTGPLCRLCRREGVKLFLKGERCNSSRCALERGRDKPPGMHTWRRGKSSEYGLRLREKQKVKRYYGLFELQFSRYYDLATKIQGNTGENLLVILERRLDNVVCRGGLAHSRNQARQLVAHGHVIVNGKKVDLPGYLVKQGDVVAICPKADIQKVVKELADKRTTTLPSWLERTPDKLELRVVQMPNRSEVPLEIHENLIVEFCSR